MKGAEQEEKYITFKQKRAFEMMSINCKNCLHSVELMSGQYACQCLQSEFYLHFKDPDDHCLHVMILPPGQMTEKELNI